MHKKRTKNIILENQKQKNRLLLHEGAHPSYKIVTDAFVDIKETTHISSAHHISHYNLIHNY